MLVARFDGACEPRNPGGYTACACVIERDGVEVYRRSRYIGRGHGMTNNVAEFSGLLLILEWYRDQKTEESLHIIGDSLLAIRRMLRRSRKPPEGAYAPVAVRCVEIALPFRGKLTYEWQPRMHNEDCDAMCALEIEEVMYQERIAAHENR